MKLKFKENSLPFGKDSRNYKVAIIGAGICGLYLGWKLAEKGHKVTIFEKKKEIGKRVCSGLFSERILGFVPPSRALIQNQISSCLVRFPKKAIKVNFKRKFFVIERYRLDNLVADLGRKAGAEIVLDSQINRPPDGFDYIIGCDGYNSQIRKYLRRPDPAFFLGIQGFVEKEDFSKQVTVWPQKKEGFLWKIPRGREIEYGIIGDAKMAKTNFQRFLEKEGIQIERMGTAIIPQGLSLSSHPHIALCGNAAGLTKPWSGGGVIWGLTAANIILESFPDFLGASRKMKNFFGPEILLSKILTRAIYFIGFKLPFLLPKQARIDGDFFFNKGDTNDTNEHTNDTNIRFIGMLFVD